MVASPLRNCRAAWLFEGEGLSLLSFAAFRSSSRRDIVIIGVYIVAHESIRTLWKFYQWNHDNVNKILNVLYKMYNMYKSFLWQTFK